MIDNKNQHHDRPPLDAGQITIRNWNDGQLRISLGTEVMAPSTTNPFIGDYAKEFEEGIYWIGLNGNYWNDGTPQANAADQLNGSIGADLMRGLGGNDGLAGADDDVVWGMGGKDVIFSDAGNYQLIGQLDNDSLYGVADDDKLSGDGSGSPEYNGGALAQSLKDFDGLWQIGGRTVTCTRVSAGGNANCSPRHDLVISFADSTKRIVIRGWNEDSRNLGITFGGNSALPATVRNYIGDFAKKTVERNGVMFYEMDGRNYVADANAGPTLGAQDLITGLAGAEAFYGLGGNDAILGREGDDFIDGGDGSDILQGGLGRDRIIGGDGRDRWPPQTLRQQCIEGAMQ